MFWKVILLLFVSTSLFAQTGIGTTAPHASAKLDVSATDKGFLPPRVTLTSGTDNSTISSPATGLLVYNTGNNVGLAAGYYYWNGGAWATIATAGGSGSVAAEFGTEYQASNVSVSSLTPVDILSFTLPSAGTWEVNSFVRSQGSPTFIGGFAIYDLAGSLVPNSEVLGAYGQNATTASGVIRITITGATTYKLKAWSSLGSYSVMTNGDGRTGVTWNKISGNSPMSVINFGDVKTGMQAADHNGWVRLDGRPKSTLTATQQSQATALGIGANLPNASNAFLVQNGTTLGSLSSSNTKTIAQSNLPNVSLGGSTSSDGSHTHTINVNSNTVKLVSGGTVTAMAEGNSNWTAGNSESNAGVMTTAGNHTHIVTTNSINGNVAQTTLDITPRSLSINTFIYLGF
jgi:hypothetical protein